jgi:signal transduction histidine kinase
MRKVATELRPSILDLGLNAAVEWLLEEFHSRTGVEYSLDLPTPEVEADPQLSTVVHRGFSHSSGNVDQRGPSFTRNAHRRAARRNNGDLVLEVQDNGKGISQQSSPDRAESLGILGMRERALALGGEVTVQSPASGGTAVCARIPFAEDSRPVPALRGTS